MNIYVYALRAGCKSALIWCLAICGITGVLFAFYPSIAADIAEYRKLLANMPGAVVAAFGLNLDRFSSTIGFFGFCYTYSSLFAAIHAANLGIGILSKEERERTADFLMTKPVSRIRILTAKLLAALTDFAAVNFLYAVFALGIVRYFDPAADLRVFLLICGSLFLLQITVFAFCLAVSLVPRKIKAVLPLSLGITFVLFAISAFAVTSADSKLRYLTPFQYFATDYIIDHGRYEMPFVLVGALVSIVFIALSFVRYRRRNIHAV